ncbi:MAG: recombinase family protein [Actinobacteria bacterium]|nr:recombinase family protein [Actinomycetota bacterium]
MIEEDVKLAYCLYARKSSESDERQAMSIESQIKEMKALSLKENIFIKEIRSESYSAKASGTRPVFGKIIDDIKSGVFNGILTWAPDRLSRTSHITLSLIDLMDAKKLLSIRTYSQIFSDSPNEKFLLMILCSQAKLENDNRGINVKRGIRAKCDMGWRPCMPPLGYYNRAFGGIKDIIIDPVRGPIVKEMFFRAAYLGESGRKLKKWLDSINFTTKSGKHAQVSLILSMLKNPFYYGEFEYPLDSGHWYKGSHETLITKEIFEKAAINRTGPRNTKYGSKEFTYKDLFKCGNCGNNIVAEDKFKKLLDGNFSHHIYYHCSKTLDNNCGKHYLRQEELEEKIVKFIEGLDLKDIKISSHLKYMFEEYKKIAGQILAQQNIDISENIIDLKSYARYVFKEGSARERAEFVKGLGIPIYLYNKNLYLIRHIKKI